MQIEVQRQKQQRRQLQLEASQRSPSVILRLLSQGWLKSTYAFADHTRNALILSVFAFKVWPDVMLLCINTLVGFCCKPASQTARALCSKQCQCCPCFAKTASWSTCVFASTAFCCLFLQKKDYVQLLEWWYTSAEEKLGAQQALPPPPPPPPPKPSPDGLQLPDDTSVCPICRKKRTNPAMASVSGYVYCYPCIFGSINQHGCCPVTRRPATVDQVRRLYQSA